jgi:hypothetical protein
MDIGLFLAKSSSVLCNLLATGIHYTKKRFRSIATNGRSLERETQHDQARLPALNKHKKESEFIKVKSNVLRGRTYHRSQEIPQ